jgi:hypothetical protein
MAAIDIQIGPRTLIERLMGIAPIHIGPEACRLLQNPKAQGASHTPFSQLITVSEPRRQMARMGTNR